MIPYLTWSTIVFAAALILVEATDAKDGDYSRHPISYYFKTPTSVVQATMFLVMAAALWVTAWGLGFSWLSVSFAVVGLGLVLAMSTDTWPRLFFGYDEKVHYAGAFLCFTGGLSMMLADKTYTYAAAYVLGAGLLYVIDREHTAVQEKIGVLLLVVWVFGYSINLG